MEKRGAGSRERETEGEMTLRFRSGGHGYIVGGAPNHARRVRSRRWQHLPSASHSHQFS